MPANVFNAPAFEVSWDNGKTWQEGWNFCGPGLLARIVAPGGEILWQGRGVAVEKQCTGCDGTGKRDYYEFRSE